MVVWRGVLRGGGRPYSRVFCNCHFVSEELGCACGGVGVFGLVASSLGYFRVGVRLWSVNEIEVFYRISSHEATFGGAAPQKRVTRAQTELRATVPL